MGEPDVLIGAMLEDACLTIEELAGACAVTQEWIASHVRDGLLQAEGELPDQWRFTSHTLWRVQQLRIFEQEFEAVPELAALVADLLEEIDAMRARLRRSGMG
jgi:chaperone modulatory protein CbpM